jgi:hypothetical protein
MLGPWRCIAALLLAGGVCVSGARDARSETEVDLALVLAVDVSLSMGRRRYLCPHRKSLGL